MQQKNKNVNAQFSWDKYCVHRRRLRGDGGIDPHFYWNELKLSGYPPHFNNVQQFSYIEFIFSIKSRHRIVINLS